MPVSSQDFASLKRKIMDRPITASDGNHSARLWRIAENLHANEDCDHPDDRLLHLMSRVSVLTRGLARDLRIGQTLPGDAANLLDQLADLGEIIWTGEASE